MLSTRPTRTPDVTAVLVLLVAAAVIAWPVLTGGYYTYMDNPAHLAEVHALAFEAHNGWSDIAYCGFPVSTLHSPLWYGALGRLARAGLPADIFYAWCLLLAFCLPPLAVYYAARRRAGVIPSTVLAYLLLVQRPVVVGVGSALGGMWTFYVASAALVLLIDRLARPGGSGRDLAATAGLTGFMLLTHLFTVIPLLLTAALYLWLALEKNSRDVKRPAARLGAILVGVVAAAAHWLPKITAGEHGVIVPQDLSAQMILARLFLPANMLDLLNDRLPAPGWNVVAGALPMIVLFGLGAVGTLLLRRRKDDAPVYGAALAAVVLVLLCVIAPEFDVKFLGPVSWRILYFVRLGLCLAAVPFLVWAAQRVRSVPSRPSGVALAVMAVAAAVWWGAPLRSAVPDPRGSEMSEVRGLWRWLEETGPGLEGRVYLQDTFTRPGTGARLEQSHILALTARETGVRQLGAGYGAVPYRTALWTPSEFETMYRRAVADEQDVAYVMEVLSATNAGHVVLSDSLTAGRLLDSGFFSPVFRSGRFRVYEVSAFDGAWGTAGGPDGAVEVVSYSTGLIALRVLDGHAGGDFMVKAAWHPNWRIKGATGALIEPNGAGLMVLRGVEPGAGDLVLEYVDSRLGRWLSLSGWVVVMALMLVRPGKLARGPKLGVENLRK